MQIRINKPAKELPTTHPSYPNNAVALKTGLTYCRIIYNADEEAKN